MHVIRSVYVPQAIFYKKYSVQSDVWSFGCVMYEIWSLGHKPFEDLSGKEVIYSFVASLLHSYLVARHAK